MAWGCVHYIHACVTTWVSLCEQWAVPTKYTTALLSRKFMQKNSIRTRLVSIVWLGTRVPSLCPTSGYTWRRRGQAVGGVTPKRVTFGTIVGGRTLPCRCCYNMRCQGGLYLSVFLLAQERKGDELRAGKGARDIRGDEQTGAGSREWRWRRLPHNARMGLLSDNAICAGLDKCLLVLSASCCVSPHTNLGSPPQHLLSLEARGVVPHTRKIDIFFRQKTSSIRGCAGGLAVGNDIVVQQLPL